MVRADPCASEYGPADNVLYKICSSGLMGLLTKFATPVDIETGNSVFGGEGARELCLLRSPFPYTFHFPSNKSVLPWLTRNNIFAPSLCERISRIFPLHVEPPWQIAVNIWGNKIKCRHLWEAWANMTTKMYCSCAITNAQESIWPDSVGHYLQSRCYQLGHFPSPGGSRIARSVTRNYY